MQNELLDKDNDNIISILEDTINNKILIYEKEEQFKKYDINKIKTNSPNNYNLILEECLNYYLEQIKNLNVKDYFEVIQKRYLDDNAKMPTKYKKAEILIDDIIESFDPCGRYDSVYEEAEHLALTFIRKKIDVNNQFNNSYLNLDNIKLYSISTSIPSTKIDDMILYIILYIATHYYVLSKINPKI